MADAPMLTSARILVVGASAGIGRAFARSAVGQGASVCVAARRHDALVELCAEAGGGTPVAGDLTKPDDCERIVAAAVEALGGLDLVVFAAGAGALARMSEPDAASWAHIYAVNTIGPTVLTAAALPHLSADGIIVFCSSESTGQTRWGLGSYTASKAALDASIRQWRLEHPERRFLRVELGATMPTEFGANFEADVLTTAFDRWAAVGVSMTYMETDEVGQHLAETFAVLLAHPTIDVPDLFLDAREEPWPT